MQQADFRVFPYPDSSSDSTGPRYFWHRCHPNFSPTSGSVRLSRVQRVNPDSRSCPIPVGLPLLHLSRCRKGKLWLLLSRLVCRVLRGSASYQRYSSYRLLRNTAENKGCTHL